MSNSREIATTISEQVYNILKDDICKGVYKPGQKLLETSIANDLHVSRSPVREALHQLAGDGIAVEIANRGVFVREFTAKDIEEIYEVRVALECTTLQEIKGLSDFQKQNLEKILQELQQDYDNKHLDDYIQKDTLLHRYLVVCGGNELMLQLYDKVGLMSNQFRTYSLQSNQRFDDSIQEHRNIIENLLHGNMNEAAQIDRKHLKLARDKAVEYLNGRKSKESAA